jgi:hypothetical protein
VTSPETGAKRPGYTALFGAAVGFGAAALWFLPRLAGLPVDASTPEGVLHLAALLLIPAGTGALFAIVLGGFVTRFGLVPVGLALLALSVVDSLWGPWRRGDFGLVEAVLRGCAWGAAMAVFAAISERIFSGLRTNSEVER